MPEMPTIGFRNWIVVSVRSGVSSSSREDGGPDVFVGLGVFIRGGVDRFLVLECRLIGAGFVDLPGQLEMVGFRDPPRRGTRVAGTFFGPPG